MGYSKEEIDKKLMVLVDFADIGDFIYQPVKTYSSGMFARLAFSVAISVEPEILIVDETLSVGDSKFQIKCIEKMDKLNQRELLSYLFLMQLNRFVAFVIELYG